MVNIVERLKMDDATRRYLISPRIQTLRVPYVVDKAQVLEITSQLLDRNDLTGTLREAFDAYVGACMEYNMQRVVPPSTPAPIPCDNFLLPPKKLSTFVVRKKNLHLVHEKHSEVLAVSEGDNPGNVPAAGGRRASQKGVQRNTLRLTE